MSGLLLASVDAADRLNLTTHWAGYVGLAVFVIGYLLVVFEERTHLLKSKPVLAAAAIMWVLTAIAYHGHGKPEVVEEAARHNLLEYAELMLFLMVAMTYVNAMEERRVFDALRSWMSRRKFTLRKGFWLTGALSFCISPIADNLTTALLMCAVVLAVAGDDRRFVATACTNIVVAANAGGAFSPFGDITTLMVWQKGVVHIYDFFRLFPPSLVSWVLPAAIMSFTVPNRVPEATGEDVMMKRGALRIVGLFILTIITAVVFHSAFHLPPVMGMLAGMAYLGFFGHYLKRSYKTEYIANKYQMSEDEVKANQEMGSFMPFDVYGHLARSEWDTLIFFYGVVMCVGALSLMGYLDVMSGFMYHSLGATKANVGVGVLSSVIDNIPVMFAVLSMHPEMSIGQWLLVTLTAGIGGSLLSVGSAAGVALMGQSRGAYTFSAHLKWTPVIALGYAVAIGLHLVINSSTF
ncbi:MAG: sodium:proton antiporter NhaD [Polyangiaceae bacterium]|nr:sodium:proton antiporter NhaD [Myxococcales bacterium]MCB9589889.1 sodium:proton antiporter NhaD [Polyangiaceae bacterium]MCB9610400.1 sodium:proton antiporter NhaD [Polyangiaceae bacterium]